MAAEEEIGSVNNSSNGSNRRMGMSRWRRLFALKILKERLQVMYEPAYYPRHDEMVRDYDPVQECIDQEIQEGVNFLPDGEPQL
ncbi:hypothetical protein SLEP1_g57226 [Rubroshorea leprosula]|uniref:Uncharacterized protein n=1 Tax=Rubroshorea leprosula TaxID=152421 RepID=A0AAV5MNW0_9ROSI|nr:hypothetical protein SLEP1_g57226 [Rubroshorea leprosula]